MRSGVSSALSRRAGASPSGALTGNSRDLGEERVRRRDALEVAGDERLDLAAELQEQRRGEAERGRDRREPVGRGDGVVPVLDAAQVGAGDADAVREGAQAQARLDAEEPQRGPELGEGARA
jgi:hypothetical protein